MCPLIDSLFGNGHDMMMSKWIVVAVVRFAALVRLFRFFDELFSAMIHSALMRPAWITTSPALIEMLPNAWFELKIAGRFSAATEMYRTEWEWGEGRPAERSIFPVENLIAFQFAMICIVDRVEGAWWTNFNKSFRIYDSLWLWQCRSNERNEETNVQFRGSKLERVLQLSRGECFECGRGASEFWMTHRGARILSWNGS